MSRPTYTIGIDARFINHPGIGRYVSQLLRSLPERFEILAVCLPGSSDTVTALRPTAEVAVTNAEPFSVHEQVRLPRLLGRKGIDCFHATQFTVPAVWRGPLVTTIHDCAYDRFSEEFGDRSRLARYYLRTMMRLAVARSNRIVTPSNSTKRDVKRFYGGDDSRLATIYNGVDTDKFDPDAPSPTVVDGDYLLHVGSTRPRKNVIGLLDGYARAVEQLNGPPKLVMVGDHNPRFLDLDTVVASRGLPELVVRPGYVDDDELICLYANALAFVFPSFYEGFGLPVLEAMASNTAVIAADAPALPEVCGDAALYVDPDDSRSIATGIVNVVSSADQRERLQCAGQKRVGTFTWERTASETAGLYESLLEP